MVEYHRIQVLFGQCLENQAITWVIDHSDYGA